MTQYVSTQFYYIWQSHSTVMTTVTTTFQFRLTSHFLARVTFKLFYFSVPVN